MISIFAKSSINKPVKSYTIPSDTTYCRFF